jgi:hypothetical protein
VPLERYRHLLSHQTAVDDINKHLQVLRSELVGMLADLLSDKVAEVHSGRHLHVDYIDYVSKFTYVRVAHFAQNLHHVVNVLHSVCLYK